MFSNEDSPQVIDKKLKIHDNLSMNNCTQTFGF